jgi:hypothetical protein
MTPKDEELLRELVAASRNVCRSDEREIEKAIDRVQRAIQSLELKSTLPQTITGADFP